MNLSEFILIIVRRLWILIIAIVICVGSMGYLGYFYMTKQYEGTVTVFVLKNEEIPADSLYQELLAGLSLIKDYKELITSRAVLSQVKEQLKSVSPGIANISANDLAKKVTIKNKSETHIVSISVRDNDPEQAALIANTIASVFATYTKKMTNFDSIQMIDNAESNFNPVQPKPLIYMFLGAVVGVLIGILTIFINYFSSKNPRTRSQKYVQTSGM